MGFEPRLYVDFSWEKPNKHFWRLMFFKIITREEDLNMCVVYYFQLIKRTFDFL